MLSIAQTTRNVLIGTHHDTKKIFVSLTVNFVLRNYIRKNGTSPIYLHVYMNGERERISLELFCEPDNWDKEKQRAKKNAYDLNLILDGLHAKITEIKTQYRLSYQVLTLEKFLTEFNSEFTRIDFIPFFEMVLRDEKGKIAPGTYRRYKSVFTKTKNWKKSIMFSEINYSFWERYQKHLRSIGNNRNTISGNLRVIRKILHIAKRHGIFFPLDLDDLKIRPEVSNRVNLKPEQVKILYEYYTSKFIPEEWKLILGYFLFSCFTGLRISDVNNLKRENIQDSFQIKSQKSGRLLTVNLNETAKAVLKAEPALFVKFLTPEYINRELKKIAKAVGIKETITFHVSRHTFATNYLRMGGNIVLLSKLLGHADIKTTMIYLNITEEEKNKEINLLDRLF